MIERSAVYLDTSAIVKLLVDELGSAELAGYLDARPLRIASRIAEVEVRRAVARLGEAVDPGRVDRVLAALTMVELEASLAFAAGRLVPPALRTLDAIHLATALELIPDLEAFVTYDRRLAEAARLAGMAVVSPGSGGGLEPGAPRCLTRLRNQLDCRPVDEDDRGLRGQDAPVRAARPGCGRRAHHDHPARQGRGHARARHRGAGTHAC